MRLRYLFYLIFAIPFFFSCTDDSLVEPSDENTETEQEKLEEGITSLDLFLENPNVYTRDVSFEEGATVSINTIWLGIFDLQDGKCVEKLDTIQDYKYLASGEIGHGVLRLKFKGPKTINGVDYKNRDLFMVAVANFKDVKARDAREAMAATDDNYPEHYLSELLESVENWEDFNHIGIDTYTSYYENDHNKDVPIIAGFLNSNTAYNANVSSSTHIKINQFATTSDDDKVKLLPTKFPYSGTEIKTSLKIRWNDTNKRYVAPGQDILNHTIFFRRLVANINIKVIAGKDYNGTDKPTDYDRYLEITDVGYRRFNIPANVYIIERSMLNGGTFPKDGSLSPNFGDIHPATGYFNDDALNEKLTSNSGTGNSGSSSSETENPGNDSPDTDSSDTDRSDSAYSEPEPNWTHGFQDDDGGWNLSFQHFANKHWARYLDSQSSYADRAKVNYSDGKIYFPALADGPDDINNNASYFILKMHLLNNKLNRCAEAEYLIHEGYTSDYDGYGEEGRNPTIEDYNSTNETNKGYWERTQGNGGWNNLILKDFSTARNINYNYRIRVNRFNQIIANVNGSETTVRHDQGGKVWQMYYAGETKDADGISDINYNRENNSYTKYIPREGGIYLNAVIINNNNPNIAFRLYGYNSSKNEIEGFNYNFPDNSFNWLKGLWPPSIGKGSHYFQDYESLLSEYEKDDPQIDDYLYQTFRFIESINYDVNKPNIYKNYNQEGEWIGYIDDNNIEYNDTKKDLSNYNYWLELVDFIKLVNDNKSSQMNKSYHIKVAPRKVFWDSSRPKADYLRAIFICDRNGQLDSDGCSKLVNVYAAVQGID